MAPEEECSLLTLIEEKLLKFNLKPILICISGSHAYSTNVEGSDVDIRGVFIQPTETMLGLTNYIPQVSDETNDTTFYEIGRFLELAAKGNPNIMELLNMPKEQIVYKSELWDEIFTPEIRERFITTKLKHTFTGFAYAQIKKARGQNKMIAWEKHRVERKDPLDFCYVITGKENSMKFKNWSKYKSQSILNILYGNRTVQGPIKQSDIGLAKVNNAPDLYSMYHLPEDGGIVGEKSNGVQLRSIPTHAPFIGYLRFDQNAYSSHCKDYRQYTEWIEKRNPERYENNQKHGKGYDSKNLMHTFRLLNMARDIADGKGIVVRRPEREELLSIRRGDREYDKLLATAEKNVEEIKALFDKADLPREVSIKWLNKFLTEIRIANLSKSIIFDVL